MATIRNLMLASVCGMMLTVACSPNTGEEPSSNEPVPAPEVTSSTDTTASVAITESSREAAREAIREGAEQGDESLALIQALEKHRPAMYNEFVDTIAGLIDAGTLNQADATAAGAALRPKLLDLYGEAMLSASDANVMRLINHTIGLYKQILEADPQECVRNINGLPPRDPDVISNSMQKQENDIMIAIFEEGPVEDDFADQPALMEWMVPKLQSNPDHLAAFALDPTAELTDTQATAFCEATIFVMEQMQVAGPEEGSRLFRGSLRLE